MISNKILNLIFLIALTALACAVKDYPHTNELDPQSNNYIACGNGYLDANEECDNGKENTSSCNFNCTLPVCGDALKNMAAGEECDNGLLNSDSLADACRTDCKAAYCGDNVTDTGEECDDGNTISGDGCQADCKIAVCGDGIHDIGEECDDGEFNSNTTADACRENCKNPSCGDYTVDTNEECDGGGAQSITCEAECTIPICGDSIVNMLKGEECDTGGIDTSVCDADCTLPVCGDTYVNRETAETCDDGNTITEFCVTGETSCITCDRNCIEVVREGYCGDGIIQEGEICDDGNNINGDNCSEFCNNEYIQISAGWGHTAAIKGDSTLWTWGYNARGQIGDGSTTNKYLPAQIGTSTNWAYVSAGKNQHMAAVKTNGTLWAWGWNGNGQLGDGTQVDKHSPVQVGVDTDWSIVSVGDRHTAAIKADGSLWAWGSGYLGDGTTSMRTSPVQIGTGTCTLAEYQTKMDCETNTGIWTFDTDWISVSAGSYFSIAIKIDGTLWSWGTNSWGELGLGDNTYQLLPQLVGACSVMGFYTQVDCEGNSGIWNYDTDWTLAAVGYKQAIALKSNGTLWAWGRNDYGQVGDGTSATRYLPVQIGADIDWISVSAGNNHSIAVKANKNIWAWGYNAYGQLGENTTETRFSPVLISSEVDWLKVSAGANHSIALKTDNTLWVWGAAGSGRLGIEKEFENAPKQLGASAWLAVSTGISHTVALKSDNSLWSWGNNAYGQLGDNTVIQRSLPVQVGAYFDWEKVSARYNHTAAIKADGTLWTWGANNKGQLGDGTIVDKSAPVKVGIETDWLKVSTGGAHTAAVKTEGSLWAWGLNSYGQLGNNSTTDELSPVQIASTYDWADVFLGLYSSAAKKNTDMLFTWGLNNLGQLGDSSVDDKHTPLQISLDSFATISFGEQHAIALKSDGTLWAWGLGNLGQLGDGGTIIETCGSYKCSTVPVQIGSDNDWVEISSGYYHNLAVKLDGTLWGWGGNWYGQLGDDGAITETCINPSGVEISCSTVPVQIGVDIDWQSVSGGKLHSFGIKTDGILWGWGNNSNGELGNGYKTIQATPVSIQ